MLLNQHEVERYIYATCRRANIEVKWSSKGEAATNGKTMWLPRISENTTIEEAENLMSLCAHESTHVLHSDFDYTREHAILPEHSLLGAITNIIEDDGVDSINSRQFYGDRIVRNRATSNKLLSICKSIDIKRAKGLPWPAGLEALTSLMSWMLTNTSDYYPSHTGLSDEFYNRLDDQGKEWVDKLKAGNYDEAVKAIRVDESLGRTAKAYEIAKKIFREVFDQDPEKEEERCKDKIKELETAGEGKGEGEEEGEGAGEGKGEGKGDAAGDGVMGAGDGEPRSNKEFYNVDYRPLLVDNHTESLGGSRHDMGGMHIEYTTGRSWEDEAEYVPTSIDKTYVIDYPAQKSNHSRITTQPLPLAPSLANSGVGFANSVRRLLQIRSKSRFEYGTKSGKLHAANMHRVVLKNAPGYSERVFKKKITSTTLDTAVMVLGDISGSMSGHKMKHEMQTLALLNDCIGNALHIPLEMLGFTELNCKNAMFIWRKFDDKMLSRELLLRRMEHSTNHMEQNADGDSILYGYGRLICRKEKRKVMIVCSDGSPASSRAGDVDGYTRRIVKEIEMGGLVEIVGIGICDNNVARIYKHNETIQQAEELEQALLKIIERKII